MSMKHVKGYFSQVAYQYFKMLKMLEGFEKELQEGKVEESQVATVRNMIEPMKANYDRLAYIIYLFNIPKDPKNRKNREEQWAILENYFDRIGADQKHVDLENADVLKNLKEYLKENGYYDE